MGSTFCGTHSSDWLRTGRIRSARTLPGARGGGQRLFAFGADAWRLVAYFERLYNEPSYAIPGATGELQIAVDGGVTRTPAWAVFSGGRGRPAPAVAPRNGGSAR